MTGEAECVDEWIVALLNGDESERPDGETVAAWAGRSSHDIRVFWHRHDEEALLDAIEWVVDHDEIVARAAEDLDVSHRSAARILFGVERYVAVRKYETQRWEIADVPRDGL